MNVEVFIYFKEIAHGELGSILIRTGPTPCTGLSDVRQVPARPYSICRLGFNFDCATGLFTVPGLSKAYLTYTTSLNVIR